MMDYLHQTYMLTSVKPLTSKCCKPFSAHMLYPSKRKGKHLLDLIGAELARYSDCCIRVNQNGSFLFCSKLGKYEFSISQIRHKNGIFVASLF